MKPEAELALVLSALEQRGVEIRSEACDSVGGLVRVRDRYALFLNPARPLLERIAVAIAALRRLGIDGHFLPPYVREMIEKEELREKG